MRRAGSASKQSDTTVLIGLTSVIGSLPPPHQPFIVRCVCVVLFYCVFAANEFIRLCGLGNAIGLLAEKGMPGQSASNHRQVALSFIPSLSIQLTDITALRVVLDQVSLD